MARMYFVALVAPDDVNAKVAKWKLYMKERFGCEVALRSPAHITLVPPFWMAGEKESALTGALVDFSSSRAALPVTLDGFAAFRPRVIYVKVLATDALARLQKELFDFLLERSFPVKPEQRTWHPHVTIATRDLYKKAFGEAWEHFSGETYSAQWGATGLSVLRHDQKKWDVIHTSHFRKNF